MNFVLCERQVNSGLVASLPCQNRVRRSHVTACLPQSKRVQAVATIPDATSCRSEEAIRPAQGQDKIEEEPFVWRENWFPSMIVSYLSKSRPNTVKILNEDIVIWWSEENHWLAAQDACPHKLAPLSEGRMDNGVLECRYHGWQFNSKGNCQFSPQSATTPLACLRLYPTQEHNGMLWIWPQTGADAFLKASQKKPPVPEMFNEPLMPLLSSDFTYLKLPANWSLWLENAMDPTHAACLHEGFMGKRVDMVPMSMTVETVDTKEVLVKHNGYLSSQQANKLDAIREFTPPCTVRTHYTTASGTGVDAVVLATPEKPGSAHLFSKFLFSSPQKPPSLGSKMKARAIAVGVTVYTLLMRSIGFDRDVPLHIFGQKTLNEDSLMLHHADRQMIDTKDEKGGLNWRKYRLASQADAGIAAFWKWMDRFGGEPDWAGNVKTADLSPHVGRDNLFNHYERHTKHCPKCLKALDQTKRIIQVLNYMMAGIVGCVIVFRDSTSHKVPVFLSLGTLFLLQRGFSVLEQRFYGRKNGGL